MNVYFTADLHIGHEKILSITERGNDFSGISQHDGYLIDKINEIVGRQDRLYIAGDFCYNTKDYIKGLRKRINCADIRFARGNHDPLSRTAYQEIFTQIGEILSYKYGEEREEKIIVSHFPQICWDQSFRGSICVFGHVHAKINPWLQQFLPDARLLDIGIDSAKELLGEYRPFSLDEIKDITLSHAGYSPDMKWGKINNVGSKLSYDCIEFNYDWGLEHLPSHGQLIYSGKKKYLVFESVLLSNNTARIIISINQDQFSIGDIITWK